MNDEASRIYKYTFISKANSKFELLVRLQIPNRVLCAACRCLFTFSKMTAFVSYLMIFIWQRSLTIEIPEMPCTGEIMGLYPRKLETVRPFLECIIGN